MSTNKAILIITDGIGSYDKSEFNAFKNAKKPTYDRLFKEVPNSLVKTSGLSVGLPEGQMGNSEVGHMCLGSGRVLYQNLVKINRAIEDGSLAKNSELNTLFSSSNDIHLVALLSDGGVHSHINHIISLMQIAKQKGKKIFLHAIGDGRDVDPKSLHQYIKMLPSDAELATLSGRFYTMDRDKRWERVKKGYDAIVNASPKTQKTPSQYVDEMYAKDITDEFIEPVAFGDFEGIKKGDGIILANFRNDRMRELAEALGVEGFNEFEQKDTFNVITMTKYDEKFDFPIMFKPDVLKNTLGEVISQNGLSQFHTAETEKYAHVTFFFNGGVEQMLENESRVLIPSPKVKTYDEKPEMSAKEVSDAVLKAMDEEYDFIVVNFANGDMVGHTGVFDAGVKAVEAVDAELGRIFAKGDEKEYSVVLTSDHGNCEQMQDEKGNILTNHTTYDVFCFVKANGIEKVANGGLSNIAPTILKLMNLPIPAEMEKPLI